MNAVLNCFRYSHLNNGCYTFSTMFARFKPHHLSAEVRPARWFSKVSSAFIVDISETGIGVRTPADLKQGSHVKVTLVNGSPDRPHKLAGTIRYTGAAGGGLNRIDIHFDELTSDERAWIRSLRT